MVAVWPAVYGRTDCEEQLRLLQQACQDAVIHCTKERLANSRIAAAPTTKTATTTTEASTTCITL